MRNLPRAIMALLVVMTTYLSAMVASETSKLQSNLDALSENLNTFVTTKTSQFHSNLDALSERARSIIQTYSPTMDGAWENLALLTKRASSYRVSMKTPELIGQSAVVVVDSVEPGQGLSVSVSTQPNTALVMTVHQYSANNTHLGSTAEQLPQKDLNCQRNVGFAVFPQDIAENITYVVTVSGTPSSPFTLEAVPSDFRISPNGPGRSFVVEPCSPAYFMVPVTDISDKSLLSIEAISDERDITELYLRASLGDPNILQHPSLDMISSSDIAEQEMDQYGQLRFLFSQMSNQGKGMYYGRIALMGLGDSVSPLTMSRTVTVHPELHSSHSRLAFWGFVVGIGVAFLFVISCLYIVIATSYDKGHKKMFEKDILTSMVGFVFILALIYAIPSFQYSMSMLTEYLNGRQDKCYFNFKCSQAWWKFLSFNNVISNLMFWIFGLVYGLAAFKRHNTYAEHHPHYILHYAIGLSIFFQAIFSVLYHICPNMTNLQFDNTFIIVILALCVFVTWEHICKQDSDMFERLEKLINHFRSNSASAGPERNASFSSVPTSVRKSSTASLDDCSQQSDGAAAESPCRVGNLNGNGSKLNLSVPSFDRSSSGPPSPRSEASSDSDSTRSRSGRGRQRLTLKRFVIFMLVMVFFTMLIAMNSYPQKPLELAVILSMIVVSFIFAHHAVRTELDNIQRFHSKRDIVEEFSKPNAPRPVNGKVLLIEMKRLLYTTSTVWWIRFFLGLGVVCSLGDACFLIYNYLTGVKMPLAFIIMSIVVVWQVVLYALVMVKGRQWADVSDSPSDNRCCGRFCCVGKEDGDLERSRFESPMLGANGSNQKAVLKTPGITTPPSRRMSGSSQGNSPKAESVISVGDGGEVQVPTPKRDVTPNQSESQQCCSRKARECCSTTNTWYAILILLSLVFFGVALTIFFKMQATDISSSPALSRDLNQDCVFGVWDMHDVWHLLVSFALMTCLCGQLVMPFYNNPDIVREAKEKAANSPAAHSP